MRLLIVVLLPGLCLPSFGDIAIPEDESFTFAVLGDTRGWGEGGDIISQPETFKTNIRCINLLSPDFAIDVGDLILGYVTDPDLIHKEWDAYFETIKMFEVPIVSVVGNHDVYDEQSQGIFLKRVGPLYFSFDHKGCHLICLSSDTAGEMDNIVGEQLEWLKGDLKAAGNAHRIYVFLHKPLWGYNSNWMKDVHPILAEAGVDTVFAGHEHVYRKDPDIDGVRYIVTGGGGAEIGSNPAAGDFRHFLICTVRGTKTSIALIKSGDVHPETLVTRDTVGQLAAFDRVNAADIHLLPAGSVPNRPDVEIHLTNPLDAEVGAVVDWDPASNWPAYPPTQSVVLAPGSDTTVRVRLASGDETGPCTAGRYRVTYTSEAMAGEYVVANAVFVAPKADCRPLPAASVDGELGEWPRSPDVVLSGGPVFEPAGFRAQVESPEDLSAKVWFGWDACNLYVAVAVTDDVYFNTREGGDLYNGDGVIVAIDPLNNGRDPANPTLHRFDGDDWQICLARTKKGVECWGSVKGQFRALPAVKTAVEMTGDAGNAVYEMAVPWSELGVKPKRGMQVGISVKICEDDDGKGRAGVMAWTEPNDPVAFAALTLR
jgi:Icc protein